MKPYVHAPPELQGQPKAPTGHPPWSGLGAYGAVGGVVSGDVGLRVGNVVGDDVGSLVGNADGAEVGFGVIKFPVAGVELEVMQRTR